MDSIWEAEKRIDFEITKIEKFKRLLSQSTPANQIYVMGKVDTITANVLKRPNARPFGQTQAEQILLALIEYLELTDEEREVRRKQATQYKKDDFKKNKEKDREMITKLVRKGLI